MKIPVEILEKELAVLSAALSIHQPSEEIREIEADWRVWLKTLFPKSIRDFAPHHEEFWNWVWSIEEGVTPGSFVAVWPRGGAKSTSVEIACIAVGALKKRKCILYICETQQQADEHVSTIASKLEAAAIDLYYPSLGKRRVNKFGSSKGWKVNKLSTSSGFTVVGIGLDRAARGIKIDDLRPDLIIFDDIDGETDTPYLTQKKIKIITRKLLPTGSPDFGVLAVQNLIHSNSIFSKLVVAPREGGADFLANRKVSGPIPAVRNLTYSRDQGRFVITGGEATWSGQNLETCQHFIDTYGLEAFLIECQHEVRQKIQGALFPEFNELIHVITKNEFAKVFPEAKTKDGFVIPATWNLGRGLDWGTTVGHPCVCVWAARPPASSKLHNSVFIYRELVRPEFPLAEVVLPVSPARIAKEIEKKQSMLEESRMVISVLSHEATGTLNTFLYDLPTGPLPFTKAKPDRLAGIAEIQHFLQIDESKPHPFRVDPRSNTPIQGCPRLFFIVDDEQGAVYTDSEGRLKVKPWKNEAGLARLRWEIPLYHNRVNADGEEAQRPEDKRDDDGVDSLKMLAALFFPHPAPLTAQERQEMLLPKNYTLEKIKEADAEDKANLWIARQMQIKKLEQEQKQKTPLDFYYTRRKR